DRAGKTVLVYELISCSNTHVYGFRCSLETDDCWEIQQLRDCQCLGFLSGSGGGGGGGGWCFLHWCFLRAYGKGWVLHASFFFFVLNRGCLNFWIFHYA